MASENRTVSGSELRMGDVVDLGFSDGYSFATVKQIADDSIHFFRPYVHTADHTYTGGIHCYIGIENFSVWRFKETTYRLVSRKFTD